MFIGILLMLVACGFLMWAVEYNRWGFASITLLGTFGVLALIWKIDVFKYIWHHPLSFVVLLLQYFVVGAIWSIIKWWHFVRRRRDLYDEAYHEYAKLHNQLRTPLSPSDKVDFIRFMSIHTPKYNHYGELPYNRPTTRDHKSRIMTWMAYWPWSFIWTFINDPVKRIFKWMYRRLQAVYEGIVDRIYAGVE